jgi:two-component system, NarL family, sensor histidine kinase DevS
VSSERPGRPEPPPRLRLDTLLDELQIRLDSARQRQERLHYAGQAAVAMELAERRREAEQIALLEDRDRIARDLHDEKARERRLRAVDDLDETTRIIRSTIFGLRRRQSADRRHGLRARVAEEVEEAVQALGFTPALRTQGLVDTAVPALVSDRVVAVLREALSNVARPRARPVRGGVVAGRRGTGHADGAGRRRRHPAGGTAQRTAEPGRQGEPAGRRVRRGTVETGGTRRTWWSPLAEPADQ